jgi:hypothetical protein
VQLNKCRNNRYSDCTACNTDHNTWRANNFLYGRICYPNLFGSYGKCLVYRRNNEFNYGFNFRLIYRKCGRRKLYGYQCSNYDYG